MHDQDKVCCMRFFTRIILGILFLGAGLMKLMKPDQIIGMLGGMGFPTPAFFGWLVLLSEVIFGLALLVGFRVKYTVWPLIIILIVAILTVWLPAVMKDFGMNFGNILWHVLGIVVLLEIGFAGPGDFAVSKK